MEDSLVDMVMIHALEPEERVGLPRRGSVGDEQVKCLNTLHNRLTG